MEERKCQAVGAMKITKIKHKTEHMLRCQPKKEILKCKGVSLNWFMMEDRGKELGWKKV